MNDMECQKITFQKYDISNSLDIINLWNREVGFIYPISLEKFNQNINGSMLYKEASTIVYADKKVIGFLLGKKYDNNPDIPKYYSTAWISLIYVSREYQRKGIGTKMLEIFEERAKIDNINKISVGADIDCFFPGIPNDFDNLTDRFFQNRNYTVKGYTHDLVKKLNSFDEDYRKYLEFTESHKELSKYDFRYAKAEDKEKVLDFFKECFFGRWYYEAKEYFADDEIKEEYLIALDNNKVIGFLRTNKCLINKISYNIMWKERFEKLDGFGPLGVNVNYRKKGIAKMLLMKAIINAYEEKYSVILIDWTGLLSIYQRFGFETWKCYQYANKVLN